ncbi:DinB family protein [Chitinophaga sp. GCM10012297]|uniref:DinB family protein n=1 Tax=Chitinophaga chungangae TaxID=2821488 RepID=A0ABS3Y938_9BACT|nr:DinB family protein [Chitinophaga chungangae]MBO9150639.1 DinB family protein [Chitinophaga chungangae]
MKELLLRFAMYNMWANQRLLAVLNGLTEEQLDRDLGSSFPSLRATAYHMWNSEGIWLQRLQLLSPVLPPARDFSGSWQEFAQRYSRQNEQVKDLIATASDAKLAHTIEYIHPVKGVCKSSVVDTLLMIFNHTTYHRGQLVTMLRRLGVSKIPSTDFIEYTLIKK